LKLYIYGYLNRIQSSRHLEREAQRNIELMWLTGRLTPDFKTIANFRKDNGVGIRNVCRQFVLLCRNLELRQNYNRLAPRLVRQVAHYAHARQFKRMRRVLRALRSRVGRVQRDIERQLQRVPPDVRERLDELLGRTGRILQQRPKDKNKLYALHAPEVECISKGKARVRYEFGVKVSIVATLKEGLVVGARSMPGNPYDGHTLHEALEQATILSDVKPEMVFVDRGYRGVEVDQVQIWRSGQIRGVTRGLKAMIRRRSAIEPTIGHMKSDGKLARNWLKGALGDALNAVLCGAGHNLRLIINKLRGACQSSPIY
jgi:IS5 family transposase